MHCNAWFGGCLEQGVAQKEQPAAAPIPGATKPHRLEENLGGGDVVLTAADLANIERAAASIQVEGEHYPPALLATTSL